MAVKKISSTFYKSDNGYSIRKTIGDRISSKTIQWWIYDNKNKYVSVVSTLKLAKEIVNAANQ